MPWPISVTAYTIGRNHARTATATGGLVKSLISVRIELLRINIALVQQRIHALESGAPIDLVISASVPDEQRAAQLAAEIQEQRDRVAAARAEADRFSGGLVQAISESSAATARNTLALLEQQYLIAKYGLAFPSCSSQAEAQNSTRIPTAEVLTIDPLVTPPAVTAKDPDASCLKISAFDSSVLSANEVYVELAWKVDISNSSERPFNVQVQFTIYDSDDFELDSDTEQIVVPSKGIGKARGKMLVSPPAKARRMTKQGARFSVL